MLTELYQRHYYLITNALIALVVISVLQFCAMPMSANQAVDSSLMSPSFHSTDSIKQTHDCCAPELSATPLSEHPALACPECDNSEPALSLSALTDLTPAYGLFYIVVQVTLNQTTTLRDWYRLEEPDIRSSLPDIYLANSVFLE